MHPGIFSIIIATLFSTVISTGVSASSTNVTNEGIILFNQYKNAEKELRTSSNIGDSNAQYYLAESLRKSSQYITPEAYKWYEAAAKQGNYYAMIRLGRSDMDLCHTINNCPTGYTNPIEWLKKAQAVALSKAQNGDAEAMYVMYEISNDRVWLNKSAEGGYALAQYWMGITIKQGLDIYLVPGARREAAKQWFEKSSVGGYPKAMIEYAAMLYEDKGDMATARHWIEASAETGFEGGVTSYGAYLAHDPDRFGFPLDLVKGYAITSLLLELNGGGNIQPYVDDILPEIASKMTTEQIEQAKIFASQWKSTHPPLSFFPGKLDD
jgi:TPR repeat protein